MNPKAASVPIVPAGWKNQLYFGDNLHVLREYLPAECVDLIYLDPPFNSNASYNVLFEERKGVRSTAQIEAFDDTWRWGPESEEHFQELVTTGPATLGVLLAALRKVLGMNDMMAYLTEMAIRLAELHRVLKPTGSLYLHCDPTASHYLKLVLDALFGAKNFRNEIVWKRTSAHNDPKRFGRIHDVLFYYAKDASQVVFEPVFRPYDEDYLRAEFRQDEDGRWFKLENLTAPSHGRQSGRFEFRGRTPGASRMWRLSKQEMERLYQEGRIKLGKDGRPLLRGQVVYLDEKDGMPVQDWWDDIHRVGNTAKERLGYPTQKPEKLLERIIQASSREGDVVLDPFCGCGTTVVVAERLNRRWIGIDVTHLAVALMRHRLQDSLGADLRPYEVHGVPKTLVEARALAEEDRFKFEWWALGLVDARPLHDRKKKGPDSGIDGVVHFFDDKERHPKQIIVSVKSGKVSVRDVRDLAGVIERESAQIGVLITLQEPTEPMVREALSAGLYQHPVSAAHKYPRLQILTISQLLEGAKIAFPSPDLAPRTTFRKARRSQGSGGGGSGEIQFALAWDGPPAIC